MENDNNPNASKDAAYFRNNPTAPVRILVKTATHIVPGDGYFAKTEFIQNLVSRHHWNHDFKAGSDRFEAYNAEFSYDNRVCYFLLDHGQSPGGNDEVVPILWYQWTGESLIPIHDVLPSRIRERLNKLPFTPAQHIPRRKPTGTERREDILMMLSYDVGLSDENFEFLRDNPEHATWLEHNMETKLRTKFESLKAKWQELEDEVARGTARRVQVPKDCTGMWDCECSLCS